MNAIVYQCVVTCKQDQTQYVCGTEGNIKDSLKNSLEQCDGQELWTDKV